MKGKNTMKEKKEIKLLSRREFDYSDYCAYVVLSLLSDSIPSGRKSYKVILRALNSMEKILFIPELPDCEVTGSKFFEELYGYELEQKE